MESDIFVENQRVRMNASGVGYAAEASELGLPAGNWPEVLSGLDAAGEPFEFRRREPLSSAATGAFRYVIYEGPLGPLTIYND